MWLQFTLLVELSILYVFPNKFPKDVCVDKSLKQLERQKQKEEMERRMLEARAKFVEKAKQIRLEPDPEDKPRKAGGGKVKNILCLSELIFLNCLAS